MQQKNNAMKNITIVPLEREELSSIIFSAMQSYKNWIATTDDEIIKNYWSKHLNTCKKIAQYMKDHYQDKYYIYESIFSPHLGL